MKASGRSLPNVEVRRPTLRQPALVALDIDGTLLLPDLTFVPGTQKALAAVRAAGVEVAIATGRRLGSARAYAKAAGMGQAPVIAADGALVVGRGDGPAFVDRPIPEEIWRAARAVAREEKALFALFARDRIAIDRRQDFRYTLRWLVGKAGLSAASFRSVLSEVRLGPVPLDRMRGTVPSFYKGFVAGERAEAARQRIEGLGLAFTTPPEAGNEFILPGVSKGTGLEALARSLGIPMSDVWAVGNDYNDVEMLLAAGRGVLMGNAPDELLTRFPDRCGPIDEGGLLRVLAEAASVVGPERPVVD